MVAAVATWAGRTIELNRLITGGTIPKNIQWGDANGAGGPFTPAAICDVNLFNPVPAGGGSVEARTVGTVTFETSATPGYLADTIIISGTITANAARSIREVGVFDSSSASPSTTVNEAGTTGALRNVTTSTTGAQVVTSTTGFPGSGNFYCQVDQEVVVASVTNGTTLNIVSRAALGSTAAQHANAAVVSVGGDGGASGMAGPPTTAQTSTLPTGGSLLLHADFAVVSLALNDSIAFTIKDRLS